MPGCSPERRSKKPTAEKLSLFYPARQINPGTFYPIEVLRSTLINEFKPLLTGVSAEKHPKVYIIKVIRRNAISNVNHYTIRTFDNSLISGIIKITSFLGA
jgi:hypothetical protein